MSSVAANTSENIAIAADIVAAYVSNNAIRAADLPNLIATVHAAVAGMAGDAAPAADPAIEKASTAQIRKSITHEALISFIDGMPYKTLKRHLTKHGLSPERYRERYGLPGDYPMACASYIAQRSSLAKAAGLGVPGSQAARAQAKLKGRAAA